MKQRYLPLLLHVSVPYLLLALLLLSLRGSAADAAPPAKPNIVFLLIDDLAYADCGFNGGREIQTPHIDRLAASGAVLEAHYVQPVCSPTRAALLTGRYATRTGVYTVVRPRAKWGLPLQERTLANALQEAGYTTAIVGKWHLGEFDPAYRPRSRGFQHQHGMFFGAIDHFTHLRGAWHDWHHDDQERPEEGYSTHLITREACRLIGAQPPDKPLFLYVPYNAVHAPLQVPPRYLEPYGSLTGGRRTLAGMLAAVDEGIGQIVASLERTGRRDQTLVVFSADNGGPRPGSNGSLRGFKGSLYEGGTRGCAFACWPGQIPAGQRIREPLHVVDWYPTLVKLAGGSLEQKQPLDGRDIWPLLTQQAPSPHDAILSVQSPTRAAVRMGDWKLLSFSTPPAAGAATGRARKKSATPSPTLELYNLATDPGETQNLADQEPQRVTALQARLNDLLRDAVPARAPGDEPADE